MICYDICKYRSTMLTFCDHTQLQLLHRQWNDIDHANSQNKSEDSKFADQLVYVHDQKNNYLNGFPQSCRCQSSCQYGSYLQPLVSWKSFDDWKMHGCRLPMLTTADYQRQLQSGFLCQPSTQRPKRHTILLNDIQVQHSLLNCTHHTVNLSQHTTRIPGTMI